jgi:nitrate reductase beta subunit
VGRIRYTGILLYDADRIEEAAKAPETDLVAAQHRIILDPRDSAVVAAAGKNGIGDDWIAAAQRSPVYRFVKEWGLALPLHAEFRTLPMLFYVPPLLPIIASTKNGNYDLTAGKFFGTIEDSRVPISYMARLFAGGNAAVVKRVLRKLWAIRVYQRARSVGGISEREATAVLTEVGCTTTDAAQISQMTALPRFDDRFVLPPYHREEIIEQLEDPLQHKLHVGVGFQHPPRRGL